jgi:hypothetical protein
VTEEIKLDILDLCNPKAPKIDFTEFVRIWTAFQPAEDLGDDDCVNYDYSRIFCA